MRIALFEPNKLMRDITMNALDLDGVNWDEYTYFGKNVAEALRSIHYDAIVTSKEFSRGTHSNIIKCAKSSGINSETPIFLFTSDKSKICLDQAFDLGITDVYYKQELPALADTLAKIYQFSRCVEGAHILYVEDDIVVSQIFSTVLKGLHCNVHVARNCESAMSLLNAHPIELVITDLNLEDGGQGQQIIREMRHDEKVIHNQIPIMVMSACDTPQTQTGLFFLGIDDYLIKPVMPMQFSMRVVNLIRKFRVFQTSQAQALELKQIAHFDKLTKVYNRHGFEDIASFCVANCQRQIESSIGIMYIDLDNFKMVNDNLGHDAGDKVLCDFAEILKIELRELDIIARWGGDEFVLLLNQCDIKFIQAIATRIESKIASKVDELNGVSCSIGIAYGQPKQLDDIYSYIKLADTNMYANKVQRKKCR